MDYTCCNTLCEALLHAPSQFGEYQVEKIDTQHILYNMLPPKKLKTPLLLISHPQNEPETLSNEDVDVSSIEGSPLKLFEFNEEGLHVYGNINNNKAFLPLSQLEARKLMSQYNLAVDKGVFGNNPAPLWMFCKPTENDTLAALGCHIEISNEDMISRTYTVTVNGPFEKASKLPKMHDFIKRHGTENGGVVDMKCFASYNLFSSDDNDIMSGHGSLIINLEWEKANNLLQTPSLDAKAKVLASVVPGDLRSAAHLMFKELTIAQNFVRGLKEDVIDWSERADDELPLLQKVKNFIEQLMAGTSVKRLASESAAEDLGSPLKTLFVAERNNLDFTEQLWDILKYCTSYKDLTDCMQYIFNVLKNGQLQPMVHKSNHTRFAELVRDSYYGKMVTPSMNSRIPLELLTEIGLEKIGRDYVGVFIGKDLVTNTALEYYTAMANLSMEEKCARLQKMNYTVELVVLLEQFLNLPRLTLSSTTRHALQYYQTHDFDPNYQFIVPIKASSVAEVIQRKQPSLWKVVLSSKDAVCVCVVSPECLLPHVGLKTSIDDDDQDYDQHNQSFYLTTIRENVLHL